MTAGEPLAPAPLLIREDVHGARAHGRGIVLISVDALGRARLAARAHRYQLAVFTERHGASKLGVGLLVGGLHVSLLRPGGAAPREQVYRAGVLRRQVGLVAVDALGAAIFQLRAHRQRVAVAAEIQPRPEPVFFT